MSEWVDDLLKRKQASAARHESDMKLLGLAKSKTPQMFKALMVQMSEDARTYADAIGEPLNTQPQKVAFLGSTFAIQRNSRYPMFEVKLQRAPEGLPIIHCLTKLAQGGDSNAEQEMIDIQIIAKGQDQYFYRTAGIDRDKAETSKIVLGPFLNIM